jgi:hypothetical protein
MYYLRIHCDGPSIRDIVGPFETVREAYNASKLIRDANDDSWCFSYVNEQMRQKHYGDKEIMPHEYYH